MVRNSLGKSSRTLWILCEGQTERRYFQNFQAIERKKHIKIKPFICKDRRADMIIEKAIQFKKSSNFEKGDLIACLFDRDNNTNKVLKSAKIKADDENIKIYFSNPCFEIWILSHYENCSSFEPDQIYSHIKQKHKLDTKNETDLYKITKPRLQNAITRCISLCKNINLKGIEILSIHSNPVTEIHKLLDLINSF